MADKIIDTTHTASAEDDAAKVEHGADAVAAGTAAAAGAHDGDDVKGTDGVNGPKGSATFTVLHTVDHDGTTHLPGDTVKMTRLQGLELVAKRVLFEGTGKDAKDALEAADKARETARLGA